jgi:hypothetical protein
VAVLNCDLAVLSGLEGSGLAANAADKMHAPGDLGGLMKRISIILLAIGAAALPPVAHGRRPLRQRTGQRRLRHRGAACSTAKAVVASPLCVSLRGVVATHQSAASACGYVPRRDHAGERLEDRWGGVDDVRVRDVGVGEHDDRRFDLSEGRYCTSLL